MALITGKLQNLSEISWFECIFWLDLCCVVLFEGKSPLKECLSRRETIGQHYSMNWSKIGHSINKFSVKFIAHIKQLHTCLAKTMNFPETGEFIGWNIIIRFLSANKDSPVCLFKYWKKMNSLSPRITEFSKIFKKLVISGILDYS